VLFQVPYAEYPVLRARNPYLEQGTFGALTDQAIDKALTEDIYTDEINR